MLFKGDVTKWLDKIQDEIPPVPIKHLVFIINKENFVSVRGFTYHLNDNEWMHKPADYFSKESCKINSLTELSEDELVEIVRSSIESWGLDNSSSNFFINKADYFTIPCGYDDDEYLKM